METLRQIQMRAIEMQKEFSIQKSDWKEEIKKIWIANKQVNQWQFIMQRAFGSPELKRPHEDWVKMEVGQIFQNIPEEWETWQFRFNHACVIQMQKVEEKENKKIIHYKAELRLDDQAFLNDMLPRSVERFDPIYKLFQIDIEVPKEQVLTDSIQLMNNKIKQSLSKKYRILRHLKQNWWTFISFPLCSLMAYLCLGVIGNGLSPTDSLGYKSMFACNHWICGNFFGIPYGIFIGLGVTTILYQLTREKRPQ